MCRALCYAGRVALALCVLAVTASAQSNPGNFGTFSRGQIEIGLWGVLADYSVVDPENLPPGVELRGDVAPWYTPGQNAGLIGNATTAGVYDFTLLRNSNPESHTIVITDLDIKDDWRTPPAWINKPFSYQMTALNAAGPVTFVYDNGIPAGLTLDAAGLISGTPTTSGFFNINFHVTDGVDTVNRSIGINVFVVEITTAGQLPNATQNQPYSTTILAAGGTGPYTFTSNGPPAGLTLASDGTLSGTPTFAGSWAFNVSATDSLGIFYLKRMTVTSVGVPKTLPRVFPYGPSLVECSLGNPCTTGVGVNNGGVAPFTWSASGLPAGMDIRPGGDGSGTFVSPGDVELWGTPQVAGTFPVTFTVTDAEGKTASQTFPLVISELYQEQFFGGASFNVPYSATARVLGGVRPYTATILSGRLPLGLTLNPSTLTVSGTPLEHGGFNFLVQFTDDAGRTLTRQQNIFVAGVGTTLQINIFDDLGTANESQFYSRTLNACCAPSYLWTVIGGTLPPGLALSAGGVLNGTLPAGSAGVYDFLVQVEDATNAANFAIRQLRLTVTSLSITSSTNLPNANVGTPYTATPTTNPAGLTWSLEPFQYLPPGLSLSAAGTISGTPSARGFFTFNLRATNGLQALVRNFSINVYAAGESAPVNAPFGPNLGTANRGQWTFSISPTGGVGPYTVDYAPAAPVIPGFRFQSGPPLPTFLSSSTTHVFFGVATTPGVYSSTMRATDSLGEFIDKPFTLTVSPLVITSPSSIPKPLVGVPYSFTLTADGGSGAYSWSASNLPPGLSIDSSGEIAGTPTAAGLFNPSINVFDLTLQQGVGQGLTVPVNAFAITNAGILPAAFLGVEYNVTFDAPGCGVPCTWTGGGNPVGAIVSSSGVLSFTPTQSGLFSFTIGASGPAGSVTKVFSLSIVSPTPTPLFITTSNLFDNVIGNFASPSLTASGGTPPYAWSLDSGALPTGVSIHQGGELLGASVAPGQSFMAGRLLSLGLHTFTLRVTDAASATATRVVTWRVTPMVFAYASLPVNGSPLLTGASGPLNYNVPYSQPLLVFGGANPYTFTAGSPMPPGLSLNPSTGLVSGTPLNTGSFTVPITATDGNGDTNTQNVGINVTSGTGVTVSFGSGPGFSSGSQLGLSQTISMNPQGGTPPYTLTALTPLPPGYFIQGTQLVGQAIAPGIHTYTVRIDDSVGNFGVRTLTFAVVPTAFAPGYTVLPDASVGEPYSHSLETIGAPAATFAVAAGSSLPAGLSLSAAGVLSGTPTSPGTTTFLVTLTNGSATVSQTLTLRVSSIVITDPQVLPMAQYGEPYSYTFTATGGGTGKVFSANLGGNFSVSSAGVLTGVSGNQNAGQLNFVLTVTDTSGTITRRFALPFTTENPSVLDIGQGSTPLADLTVNQTLNSTLQVNGGVPPYTWSVAPGSSLPPGITLMPASPGNFAPGFTLLTGAPSTPGTYAFDLIVTDSLGSTARRTYTLKVTLLGFAPNGATFTVGTPASLQLQGFGGTAPYTFTMAAVALNQEMLPPGITLSSSGLVSGTTTSTGSYAALVTMQDSTGSTFTRRMNWNAVASQTSGLFVSSLNPIAVIGRRLFLNQALTVALQGGLGTLPASVNWTLVSGALPPGLMLSNDPNLVGPNQTWLIGQPSTPGTYTYTLRATDASNASNFAEHRFTATINGMVIVPNLPSNATANVGTPYSQQVLVGGGVAPYTFTPTGTQPPGLTLSPSGLISGTPTASGNQSVNFTFTDSTGATQNGFTGITVTNAGVPAPLLALSTTPTFNNPVVGVPFAIYISQWIRGGVAPYTFALAPGSSLPSGMDIYPGGNGVVDFLGGIPTTPGDYTFDLIATDSTGQTVTLHFRGAVRELGFSVAALPPGRVGTPYLVSLAPVGGTAPYAVGHVPITDLPAGLNVSTGGVISGTPTSVGSHTVTITLVDAMGAETSAFYRLPIDNPAGEAPALSLLPNPLDIYYQLGSAAPVVPVAVNRSSGSGSFALNLSAAPWATLSATSGTAPSSVNLSVMSGLAAGSYFGVLGATGVASNFPEPVPVRLTVVPAPPCEYSVNPTSTSVIAAGGTGAFDVSAGGGCAWTAVASDTWITVTAGASGTGNGTVSYGVDPNGSASARSGTISVNGELFTISQFGSTCSFAINPVSIGAPASGGVAEVAVTASSACGGSDVWSASGLSATPTSGTGSATVTVTIPANDNAASQVLTATIAGHAFTVNQAGAACTVALSAAGASHTSAGGPGAVGITTPAGCPYSTVLGPSWIGVTSGASGTGSGTLVYSVEPNSTTFGRSGALTIGGEIFTITQEPTACSATLNTSGLPNPVAAGGGTGSVTVTMNGSNCGWTASSGAAWATVAPPSTTGSGSVLVTVSSNAASTSGRSATLTIAGQTVGLNQAGTVCTYGLLSASGSVPATGGSGSVGVVAPAACAWTSVSNDPAWLSISSSASAGNGNVNFVAQPNPTSSPRSGSLTAAGLTYSVNQAAAPCDYTLTPTNIAVVSTGVSDSFAISTPTAGCSPEAVSYAGWVQVSTSFGGTSGTVSYTVDPNPSALTRTGIVQVGARNFTVTQLGAACSYSLNAYGAFFTSAGASASFLGSPSGLGCSPTVGVDLPSIVTLGALTGPVGNIFTQQYEVSPFTGVLTPAIRKARITFGGTIFTVKQSSW